MAFFHPDRDQNFEEGRLSIFELPVEEIDWEQVPQTVNEYELFTEAAKHIRIPDDDPRRPKYYAQQNSFPELTSHLVGKEKKAFRNVHPALGEKFRHIVANEVTHRYGDQIVAKIMAATTDGVFTPENVFVHRMPDVWQKGFAGTTMIRPDVKTLPLVAEEDAHSAWWRNKYYLAVAAAGASAGLLGVMMLPIYGNEPPQQTESTNPVPGTDHCIDTKEMCQK